MINTRSILGGLSLAAMLTGCGSTGDEIKPLTRQDVEDGRPNVLL